MNLPTTTELTRTRYTATYADGHDEGFQAGGWHASPAVAVTEALQSDLNLSATDAEVLEQSGEAHDLYGTTWRLESLRVQVFVDPDGTVDVALR